MTGYEPMACSQPKHRAIEEEQICREKNIDEIVVKTDDERQRGTDGSEEPGGGPFGGRLTDCFVDRGDAEGGIGDNGEEGRYPGVAGQKIDTDADKPDEEEDEIAAAEREITAKKSDQGDGEATDRRAKDARHAPLPALGHYL